MMVSAILVQYKKTEIIRVGERNVKFQKIADKWGNAKLHCPVMFRHTDFQLNNHAVGYHD